MIKLNDGNRMPELGLGTYKMSEAEAYRAVTDALEMGYRHIDTASFYENEGAVGLAVKDSGIPREEIFITTKLWPDISMDARKGITESLHRLGTDYVDLYLIHWPMPGWKKAWEVFPQLKKEGLAKSIGVSNFTPKHLAKLKEFSEVNPAVNQFELHPWLYQKDMVLATKKAGIHVEAYSPLGRARNLSDDIIVDIAKKHAKTAAQISLRWCLQHDAIIIPKSIHKERIKENMKVFDFKLDEDDMMTLDDIKAQSRVAPDPHLIP